MSAWPLGYRVVCDVSDCVEAFVTESTTRTEARRAAVQTGWRRSSGQDIGPECFEAGWRYGRDGWTVG